MKNPVITAVVLLLYFFGIISNCLSQSVSGGERHSFFLCPNSSVWTCGFRPYLGIGFYSGLINGDTCNPIPISSLSGVSAVSAGAFHSIFLKGDGTVWTCGYNNEGQLGLGINLVATKNEPTQINSLSGIIAIEAGRDYSLFLKNDGTVWACGRNVEGQLGDGTNVRKTIPIQVTSLNGIAAISSGSRHSLFLKNDGTVWGCGDNSLGQLGDGTNMNKIVPIQISMLSGIIAIDAGYGHSLILKNDGSVWSFGQNVNGQLGDGTTIDKSTPLQINSISGITKISAGRGHSIFLRNDNSIWACGNNGAGQLGDGTLIDKYIPVQISPLNDFVTISAGYDHSLFIKNDGTFWSCGANASGDLGVCTGTVKSAPTQVTNLCNVTGLLETNKNSEIELFPNPSHGQFGITISNGQIEKLQFRVYNSFGALIYSSALSSKNTKIDMAGTEKGLYYFQLISPDQVIKTGKLIIE